MKHSYFSIWQPDRDVKVWSNHFTSVKMWKKLYCWWFNRWLNLIGVATIINVTSLRKTTLSRSIQRYTMTADQLMFTSFVLRTVRIPVYDKWQDIDVLYDAVILGTNPETIQGKLELCVTLVIRHLKVKVKVHTLDIAPLRSESPPQNRSGMARVLKEFHNFICTPTRSSAIGMSHTCLCLPSYNWYSFTDPGGMED